MASGSFWLDLITPDDYMVKNVPISIHEVSQYNIKNEMQQTLYRIIW